MDSCDVLPTGQHIRDLGYTIALCVEQDDLDAGPDARNDLASVRDARVDEDDF